MPKPAPVYNAQFVLRPEQDTSYVHFENAAAHRFQPDPAELPRVNVWWLIEAALLSYWDPSAAIPVFMFSGCAAPRRAAIVSSSTLASAADTPSRSRPNTSMRGVSFADRSAVTATGSGNQTS